MCKCNKRTYNAVFKIMFSIIHHQFNIKLQYYENQDEWMDMKWNVVGYEGETIQKQLMCDKIV